MELGIEFKISSDIEEIRGIIITPITIPAFNALSELIEISNNNLNVATRKGANVSAAKKP
jgi:hypothetical protein